MLTNVSRNLFADRHSDYDSRHSVILRTKGIGGDVGELFPTPDRLVKFLAVWESFANQRK